MKAPSVQLAILAVTISAALGGCAGSKPSATATPVMPTSVQNDLQKKMGSVSGPQRQPGGPGYTSPPGGGR